MQNIQIILQVCVMIDMYMYVCCISMQCKNNYRVIVYTLYLYTIILYYYVINLAYFQ